MPTTFNPFSYNEPYLVLDALIDMHNIIHKNFNVNLYIEESLVQGKLILDNGTEFDVQLLHELDEQRIKELSKQT